MCPPARLHASPAAQQAQRNGGQGEAAQDYHAASGIPATATAAASPAGRCGRARGGDQQDSQGAEDRSWRERACGDHGRSLAALRWDGHSLQAGYLTDCDRHLSRNPHRLRPVSCTIAAVHHQHAVGAWRWFPADAPRSPSSPAALRRRHQLALRAVTQRSIGPPGGCRHTSTTAKQGDQRPGFQL